MDWDLFYDMLFASQQVHIVHFNEDELLCIKDAFKAFDAVHVSGTKDFSEVAEVVNQYNKDKNHVDFGID